MKRLVLSILTSLVLIAVSSAQEMTVKNFELVPNDITASIERRNDANNEACALLKVQLAQVGAEFVGNVVGEVNYTTSEYRVYMTDNSKRLQVKLPGYLPLDIEFSDYKIQSLKSLSTYRLVLELPDVRFRKVNDEPSYFVLKVTPTNASVRVDGELMSLKSDGSLSVRLKQGIHNYVVEAPGYESCQASFTLGAEKKTESVNLVSNMATLKIACPTVGAEIYINDEKVGTQSEWMGTMVPGGYLIEARKEGYNSQQQSVVLAKKQNVFVSLPELLSKVGSLDVDYSPVDAEVWIDGERKGTSPNIFRELPLGSHMIEIRKDGYETFSANVIIKEYGMTTLSGSLVNHTTPTERNESRELIPVNNQNVKGFKRCPDNHHPHMIDLGLPSGTLWACCNVGASVPGGSGYYYSWGETETKQWYDWSFYKYSKSEGENQFLGENIAGTIYDVAHVVMGEAWQMPTSEQIQELVDNCKSEWAEIGCDPIIPLNRYIGVRLTGKNGGSIFLPASGSFLENKIDYEGVLGEYWSSSADKSDHNFVNHYMFNSEAEWLCDRSMPYWGLTIRPVANVLSSSSYLSSTSNTLSFSSCPDDRHPHMIDLGLPSGTKWACCNVGAHNPAEYGGYYSWGETEEKDSYLWDDYTLLNKSKNCLFIGKDIAGTKYDVAHVKWGGSWQMPSIDQFNELIENCSVKQTRIDWAIGVLVTGKNGNSIFLPAAGNHAEGNFSGETNSCDFWTSTNSKNGVNYAVPFSFGLSFNSGFDGYFRRVHGKTIRAISR